MIVVHCMCVTRLKDASLVLSALFSPASGIGTYTRTSSLHPVCMTAALISVDFGLEVEKLPD